MLAFGEVPGEAEGAAGERRGGSTAHRCVPAPSPLASRAPACWLCPTASPPSGGSASLRSFPHGSSRWPIDRDSRGVRSVPSPLAAPAARLIESGKLETSSVVRWADARLTALARRPGLRVGLCPAAVLGGNGPAEPPLAPPLATPLAPPLASLAGLAAVVCARCSRRSIRGVALWRGVALRHWGLERCSRPAGPSEGSGESSSALS